MILPRAEIDCEELIWSTEHRVGASAGTQTAGIAAVLH